MEKINNYETIFIINPDLGEEGIQALVQKIKDLIEANATIQSVEDWGKRRLAYMIDNLNEGYYTLINFASNPSFPSELERIYKITDGIVRTIVIRK